MPTTRPDTAFIDGVCSACISNEKRKSIDWNSRANELLNILETTPKNGSGFDCIVPSSGGKDSTWQVLKMIELGVRPLVVTATTCHLTSVGRANIDNLARYATTIEVSPNKTIRAKLNKIGLETVGDISWPEHVSIFTAPFQVACQHGIPLIFYGENPQEAYGGPKGTDETKEMTRRWVSEFGGFLGLRPTDIVGMDGITAQDMHDYMPPSDEAIRKVGVRAYFLGQFYQWDSHKNTQVAIDHRFKTSFLPAACNWWDFENLDNAQTGLHDHLMYRKFGYGRGCAQISVDIRYGLITRDEALDFVRRLDGEFPETYMGVPLDDIISPLKITRHDLIKVLARFTNWELFDGFEALKPVLKYW